jgi:hypothetical protein
MFTIFNNNQGNLLKTFAILEILGLFIFGVLLGVEHLINEKKKEGKWYFNVPRIIILGVSSLVFNLSILVYIFIVKLPNNMTIEFMSMNMPLFGYLLSSNFSKDTELNLVTLKNWLRYVIYGVVLLISLVGLSILLSRITFVSNIIDWFIPTEILVYFVFGVLLGIEHLINEKKKGCRWHFNISRFIIIGIPSIVVGLYLYGDLNVSGYLVNSSIVHYNYIIPRSMVSSAFLPYMLIILFGYLLPSEFYQKQA